MDHQYYKEYYDLERSNWWFLARINILKSRIKQITKGRSDLNILNIGIATGATSEMLEQFGKVKSIEYDETCYEFVKESLKLDLEQGSILELRFENESYDLVCAFDVIEHVENDQLAVNEMMRVCKAGGVVCVTVPAYMQLWSKHDEVNQHYRRYTMKTLIPLFAKSGNIVFKSYFNTLLFIPIYVVRRVASLMPNLFKRKGSGSDHTIFKSNILNQILYVLFNAENYLLKREVAYPFGVSALVIWKKHTVVS